MATDFIMPRLPDHVQNPFAQHSQHQHQQQQLVGYPSQYCGSQQVSPLSTSNNASPTSPKSYHARQLRPLYMPAVLRPTDYPPKAPPQPKTKTADGDEADDEDRPLRSSGSFISLPGLGAAIGIGRLTRRSTGDSGKCVSEGWNLDLFPEVKGLPSRSHWKPDPDSTICDEPTCQKHFSYFTRRHHCRRCGNIFCDSHSAYEIPLDENANYNPRGSFSRSCRHCFGEFKAWRSRTNSQASSNSSSTPQVTTAPTSPIAACAGAAAATAHGPPPANKPDAAQSVPHDWNWSTF